MARVRDSCYFCIVALLTKYNFGAIRRIRGLKLIWATFSCFVPRMSFTTLAISLPKLPRVPEREATEEIRAAETHIAVVRIKAVPTAK